MKHGLAIVYHEWDDPIFTTTVLPFLKAMKSRQDTEQVYVLTFESRKFLERERAALDWIPQKKLSGPFLVLRKILETLKAYRRCRRIEKIDYIIAAGLLSAAMASVFSHLLKVPFLVLTFEPHADYMVDMRRWKKSQLKTMILRFFERRIQKNASVLFATTQGKYDELKDAPCQLIPSCVDLQQFQFNQEARHQIRNQWHMGDDSLVFVYLGKFGGLYFEKTFFEQMAKLLEMIPSSKLLIISKSSQAQIDKHLRRFGMEGKVWVVSLSHPEVPNYLSAADMGITGIPSKPSMRFRSPIKNGEYWACGLPILVSQGVGDDFLLTQKYGAGVIVENDQSWCDAVPAILSLFKQPRDDLRRRCRQVAVKYRSLEKAVHLIKEQALP